MDAIGGARHDDASGDSEVQRTMLEIVNQLDGFDARGNIKVGWLPGCWFLGVVAAQDRLASGSPATLHARVAAVRAAARCPLQLAGALTARHLPALPATNRCSWPPTGQTRWTPRCCAQVRRAF